MEMRRKKKNTKLNQTSQPTYKIEERNRFSVFDHFVGLVVKGLKTTQIKKQFNLWNEEKKRFFVILLFSILLICQRFT